MTVDKILERYAMHLGRIMYFGGYEKEFPDVP